MARKTVIRRLSKRLPMSTDLEETLHADDPMYDLKDSETEVKLEKTKPIRLERIIDAKKVEVKAEVPNTAITVATNQNVQMEPGEDSAIGQEVPI